MTPMEFFCLVVAALALSVAGLLAWGWLRSLECVRFQMIKAESFRREAVDWKIKFERESGLHSATMRERDTFRRQVNDVLDIVKEDVK
jgi:hypothetical protein